MKNPCHALLSALCAVVPLAALAAQDAAAPLLRELPLVQRLRVVCAQQHFGRVEDLVVELPSGRVRAAVVTMVAERRTATVLVPFGELTYEPQANLLRLPSCQEKDGHYAPFDAAAVRAEARTADAGETAVTGTVLASRLAGLPLALQAGGPGSVQGVVVELRSGQIAFVEAAAASGRAGDADLYPVPWAALRVAGAKDGVPALALAKTADELRAAPNLVQVILSDPLYRAKLYPFYAVPRPAFERDAG